MGRDHYPLVPAAAGLGFGRGTMMLEDCEGANNWLVTSTDDAGTGTFEAAAAYQGAYGLQIKTREAGAATDDYCQAMRMLSYPESGLLVVRLRLSYPKLTPDFQFQLQVDVASNTATYRGELRITSTTAAQEYLNSGGTYTSLGSPNDELYPQGWYEVELVLDVAAMTYLEAMVNGWRVDLSDQALRDLSSSEQRQVQLSLIVTALTDASTYVYLDNVYVGEYLGA